MEWSWRPWWWLALESYEEIITFLLFFVPVSLSFCPSCVTPLSLAALIITISIYIANRWNMAVDVSAGIIVGPENWKQHRDLLVTSTSEPSRYVHPPPPARFPYNCRWIQNLMYFTRKQKNCWRNGMMDFVSCASDPDKFYTTPPFPWTLFCFFVLVFFSYLNRLIPRVREKTFLKEKRLAVLEPSKKGVVIYDRYTHPDAFFFFTISFFSSFYLSFPSCSSLSPSNKCV